MQWTRDSKNQLRFQERADKYDLFVRPELYLLPSAGGQLPHLDDDGRVQLIEVRGRRGERREKGGGVERERERVAREGQRERERERERESLIKCLMSVLIF